MKSRIVSKKRGITLLEFLIYFSLTIVMIVLIVQMSMNIFIGRERLKAQQEVNRSGRSAIDIIVESIIDAEEVVGAGGSE